MADEIAIKYKVDISEWSKAGAAVQGVTNEVSQLQTATKAAFSDKSIEDATRRLYEQGNVMGALINEYGNATSALKAMEKELATMAALGQRGTKEFKELANATAQLKDTVQDTRGEIKKMASDTKVFDTMVQGARGVAAAFSVATGLAATFGDENKDLQKTLLKVQGAMAALQGVQELANIATEKGGIATKAYGAALQVVDKISKVTGLSMAASWALATAGITVVIAGVVALIAYLNQANDVQGAIAKADEKRKAEIEKTDEINKIIRENTSKAKKLELEQAKLMAKTAEESAKLEIKFNQEVANSLDSKVKALRGFVGSFKESEKGSKVFRDAEALLLDTELAHVAVLKDIQSLETSIAKDRKRAKEETIENISPFHLPDAPQINREVKGLMGIVEEAINIQKVPEIPFKPVIPKKDLEDLFYEVSDALVKLQPVINAFGDLSSSIMQNQTAKLQEEKDKQLAIAGDNTKKREQIEKEFARKSAILARNQAIQEKAMGAVNIGINIAQAISKQLATTPLPAGAAFVALIAAQGAAQLAALLAKPIPPVPQFAKGGAVPLAGGRISDGHLIGHSHREGGILINAEGGEYIWDRKTTQRHNDIIKAAHENRIEDLVMHKYVVPMLRSREQKGRSQAELYDDMLLRDTIKHTSKQSAKEIVKGVSSALKDTLYLSQRYK